MTPVGHLLTGFCCGALVIPRRWLVPARALAFGTFAVLANAPDAPLPFWGHEDYLVSHSVFVTLAMIAGAGGLLAASPGLRRRLGGWPVGCGAAAAWASHLLLDSFYSHGQGIRILWPFSLEALRLPIPWFEVVNEDWGADPFTLRIAAIELACYGALLALCLAWRWQRKTR